MALDAVPPEVPMAAMVETPAVVPTPDKPWVWLDDRKAAAEATRYLLSLGHRTVHYLAIPSSTQTSQRQAGWRQALEEAGAPVPAPVPCGWTPRSGYQAGQRLAADPEVTAVLCGNDDIALGVMRAVHAAGLSIPGDVSVVGFDDTPVAEFLTPPLTTVRLDFAELGRACFALLGPSWSRRRMSPATGALRRPTAPARTGHQGERGATITAARVRHDPRGSHLMHAPRKVKEHVVIRKIYDTAPVPVRLPGPDAPAAGECAARRARGARRQRRAGPRRLRRSRRVRAAVPRRAEAPAW